MPLNRIAIPSPNYSSRGGADVRLIVLHTAEGATTIESLGSFFANPASGVSSHAGIDDTVNTVAEYVRRDWKAWTAGNANPVAVQAELCAFAAWDTATWNSHPNMLANTAAWVAEEAAHFGIPLVKLTAEQAQGGGRGVCQHNDLGSWGGGHWDCGPGFPIDAVVALAAGVTTPPAPAPAPPAGVPPYPGSPLADLTVSDAALVWQSQMSARGWTINTDGAYGPASAQICWQFQQEAVAEGYDTGGVDGIVGPKTWQLTWTKPVT
jgi:hypothetical protein